MGRTIQPVRAWMQKDGCTLAHRCIFAWKDNGVQARRRLQAECPPGSENRIALHLFTYVGRARPPSSDISWQSDFGDSFDASPANDPQIEELLQFSQSLRLAWQKSQEALHSDLMAHSGAWRCCTVHSPPVHRVVLRTPAGSKLTPILLLHARNPLRCGLSLATSAGRPTMRHILLPRKSLVEMRNDSRNDD